MVIINYFQEFECRSSIEYFEINYSRKDISSYILTKKFKNLSCDFKLNDL